jgi:hypothetical protein
MPEVAGDSRAFGHQQLLKSGSEQVIVPCYANPSFAMIWVQIGMGSRDEAEDRMRALTAAVAILALIAMPAQAQMGGGKKHQVDDSKKSDQSKKKVDEKAYKAALEKIPEPKEKYDPWRVARPAEPAKDAAKKPKQTP